MWVETVSTIDPWTKSLKYMGPLICKLFSIVNITVLHDWWLVEPVDMEEWWRVDYKLYTDFWLLEG